MRTINVRCRDDRELLRKIGGRVVGTCFTCNQEINGKCTRHSFRFLSSTAHMIFVCNDYDPATDEYVFAITVGISGDRRGVPMVKTPNLDTQPKPKTKKIYPGCYVNAMPFGEAVCTEISGDWVAIRYEAIRCHDQKQIWVANSVRTQDCTYLQKADKASRAVLKLKGPYGEG